MPKNMKKMKRGGNCGCKCGGASSSGSLSATPNPFTMINNDRTVVPHSGRFQPAQHYNSNVAVWNGGMRLVFPN